MAGKYTFKRDLYTDVIHSMSNSRATFLLGARKCGKTVCLKQIKDENKIYLLDEIWEVL